MINFKKFICLDDCIFLENNNSTKQMEVHLTHIEDLAIEQGKEGFVKFVSTVEALLQKLKGQESVIEINAKVDGSPALLFGYDPRKEFKNQFFIALKYVVDPARGVIKEGAKLLHSEQEITEFYGDRPSFVSKLSNLFRELERAYDKSGAIYQCDVLYASPEDKYQERIDGEDYIVFKPNVIAYAIPVDNKSETYNIVSNSTVGVVVHDSFNGTPENNYIRLKQKSRTVDSLVESGKRANVFVMGANFKQANIILEDRFILNINRLLDECKGYVANIEDIFNNQYVNSQIMEYLKIYINKQVDLPDGGIFKKKFNTEDLNKFIKGFKLFLEKRFDIEISKRSTEKGRQGQRDKLKSLIAFLEEHSSSLFALLKLFSLMIEIKKVLLILVERVTNVLKKTFFMGPDGTLTPTKPEGHVIFNGDTHVKIVDRLEFTRVNRSRGGQR